MKVLIRSLEAWLRRLPPLTLTAIGLCFVLALGAIDYCFPGPASFVLFYMLAVVFVGWGAGKWHAWLVSAVAVATMVTVHWFLQRGVPQSGWVVLWNNSMRFLVFSVAGWLTAEVTRLTRNLGRLVEERTEQWQAETERHQTTAARLTESLERFEQVINNVAEVFWLTDVAKNQMVYISPGYERIWGRKCEQLYREPRSWAAAVHPADRDEVLRRAQAEQAGGEYDIEYRILRPDGSVRWIRDRAFPVRDPQGEVYRIAGLADDITEHRKTRETLSMQAAILENMAEGVVVTDERGLIVQMNPAAQQIWGYERNEALGQPVSMLSALPEPENTEVMREVLAALQATGAWGGTFRNRRKDGAIITCEARINRVEIQGRVLMVAVEQDVTERVRVQEQLQMQARVLESMAEAVLMVDEQGTIVLTNPAQDVLLGYERGELLGQSMLVLSGRAPEEFRREFRRHLEEVRVHGSAAKEYVARRKDGALREVETRSSGIAMGGRFLMVIVGQDITQRKQAEQALRQSEESLRVFLDAVPAPAFLADRKGKVLISNPALARSLGIPAGDLTGRNVHELLPAQIAESRQAMFDQVVRDRKPVRFEDERAGRHFLNFESPVLDALGNASRVAMVALDITERKQAERALARKEELYRSLFELSPDGILLEDTSGTILDVNQALCLSFGYTREELLGRNVRCFTPPDASSEVEQHLAELQAGKTLQHEVWNLRKNGQRCLMRLNEKLLPLPDGRQGVLVVARDITATREAESTKEAFLALGAKLGVARTSAEAARAIYATADQLWQWDSAILNLYSPESDCIEPVLYCDVVDGERAEVAPPFAAGAPTARLRRIMQQGAELTLRKKGDLPDPDAIKFGDTSRASASIISAPIRREGQPIGVLSIQSYTPDAYAPQDLRTLQGLADHCAGALERLQAEVAQRETDELLRAFYDSPGGLRGIVELLEDDLLVVSASTPQAAAYGRTVEGMRRVRASELGVPRSVIDLWVEKFRQSQRNNAPVSFEYSADFRSPGTWGLATVSPLQTARSGPPQFAYVTLDITRRKRAELLREALLSLGAKLNTATTPAQAARAVYAAADQLWNWDSSLLQLYSPERDWMEPVLFCDVINGQRREVPPLSPPGGSPSPRMRRILQKGAELILQEPLTQPAEFEIFGDVSRLSASMMYVPLRREGQAVGVLSIQSYTPNAYTQEDLRTLQALADHCGGVLERINAQAALRQAHNKLEARVQERTAELQVANAALQHSEARLRLALDASNAGTWSWDAASNTSTWDNRYHELYGFEPRDPRSHDAWLARIHPEDRETLLAHIQTLREPGGGDVWDEEFRVLHPTRGERWMGGLGRIERDPSGRALRVTGINLDITERKQAEAALRRTNAILQAMNQGTDNLICLKDLQGKIILANPAMSRFLGKPEAALIGTDDLDSLPDRHQAARIRENDRRIVTTGHSETVEETIDQPDHQWHCLYTKSPYRDATGQIIGIIGIGTDITARKRAEEALQDAHNTLEQRVRERTEELETANASLRQSEERYRSLVNNLSVGVFRSTAGPGGRLVQANPALARIHGYGSLEQFRKVRVADLYQDPHERERFLADIVRKGTLRNYELRLKRKDGTPIYGSVNATAHRDSQGEVDWIDGVLEDITQQKRAQEALRASEERYRTLAELSPDAIFILDRNIKVQYVNSAAAALWRRPPAELIGLRQPALFPPEIAQRQEKVVQEVFATGTPLHRDLPLTFPAGDQWIEIRLVPLRDAKRATVSVMGVCRNITERKRAERQLAEALDLNQKMIAASTVGIAAYKATGECVFANEALARSVGGGVSEVRQSNFRRSAAWKRSGLRQMAEEALSQGQVRLGEFSARTRFGKSAWLDCQVAPFVSNGQPHLLLIALDISDRKRAEAALRQEEHLRKAILENIPDPVWLKDTTGRFLAANHALSKLFGQPLPAIVGKTVFDCLPRDAKRLTREDRQVMRKLRSLTSERPLTNAQGKVSWFESIKSPLFNNRRQVIGTVGIARDITERKQTEILLRVQRDLAAGLSLTSDLNAALKRLLEIAFQMGGVDSGGVYLLNEANGGMDLVMQHGHSPAFVKAVSHWAPDSPQMRLVRLSQPLFRLHRELPLQHDAPRLREGLRAFALLPLSHDRRLIGALMLASHTVDEIPIQTRVVIEALASQAAGAITRIRTEEALRQSEMRLRTIITGAPVLLFAVDQDGIIRFEDGQELKDLGAARGANVGRSVREAYAHLPTLLANTRRALQGEEFNALVEAGPVTFDCWYSPMRDKDGKPAGFIGVATNVTERHRLERQVLSISDREQARIGQDIHDGLCQHLVSLAFDANSLQRQLAGQHRPQAKTARRIARYLDHAITEARQLSRGLFPVRLATEGLPPALQELANTTRRRFKIRCRFSTRGPLAAADSATATHLYRIAQEAVANAVKHSQARSISIRLRARARQLELCIEDDGAGLSPARRSKAAGLGLHIMDYRARAIGGTLRLRRGRRGGTLVSCCVPRPPG